MFDGESENWYYYHTDALGSVVALSNSSGLLVERYKYYMPFGKPYVYDSNGSHIGDVSAYGNPYMFTARRYDPETGLYYYRARMYSPTLGRFLQTDPIGYYDSMNLYQYCINNPVNWVDPTGKGIGSWFKKNAGTIGFVVGDIVGPIVLAVGVFTGNAPAMIIGVALIVGGNALGIYGLLNTKNDCKEKLEKDEGDNHRDDLDDWLRKLGEDPVKPNDSKQMIIDGLKRHKD